MTIAQRLKSLSLLVGDFSALTHLFAIKQTINIVGEKESVNIKDDAIIITMSEPTINILVVDSAPVNVSVSDDDIKVELKENNISIIAKDETWQVSL